MNIPIKIRTYGQSGVQGFFGITTLFEYWYQLIYLFIPGYNFKDMHFVSKTATLKTREGNTELRKGYKLKAFLPSSIWVSLKSFWYGYMLNAIGLSNPGLEYMLKTGIWQKRTDHFTISLQLEGKTWKEKKKEIKKICDLLNAYLPRTKHSYDLQINESCPNTEHSISVDEEKVMETRKMLVQFRIYLLGEINIWLKYNALVQTEVIGMLKDHCDGFVISNTIPFGEPDVGINWRKWFKDGRSPLPKRLGKPYAGGLSGAIIFDLVLEKLDAIALHHPDANIIAGGGIMRQIDIDALARISVVKGVAIGTVAVLRPWRVKGLINHANRVFTHKR